MVTTDIPLKNLLTKHYSRFTPPQEVKRTLLWRARLTRVQVLRKYSSGLKCSGPVLCTSEKYTIWVSKEVIKGTFWM